MRIAPVIIAATMLAASPALASESPYEGDYLGFGVGYYDLFDDKDAASFEINYQYEDMYYGFRPLVGIMATSDSAVYGFAGFKWDLPIGTYPFIISPTFTVGGYHDGNGKDLGHGIEFRSGLELAYEFSKEGDRIGLHFSHISNASLGDSNPGTEILQLNYSLPIDDYAF